MKRSLLEKPEINFQKALQWIENYFTDGDASIEYIELQIKKLIAKAASEKELQAVKQLRERIRKEYQEV